MASAPAQSLPPLYNDLLPLSTKDHATWKLRPMDNVKFIAKQNAIPLTTDEFVATSRNFPIVFSQGDQPIPLVLMGLNEGVNVAVEADGKLKHAVYLPAYVRRYPFMLAKLKPDSEEMSLCFDPTSDAIGKFKDGEDLIADGKPTPVLQQMIEFCEQFDQAAMRTQSFMNELATYDLLQEGEATIQQEGREQPFVYRGFQMVNEEKLRELPGDKLRKLSQNGALPLLYAHLFSLQLTRDVFAAQAEMGMVPELADPTLAQVQLPGSAS